MRCQQQHRHDGHPFGEATDEILRALIRPVQIFDSNDKRSLPAGGFEQFYDRFPDTLAPDPRAESLQLIVMTGNAE